MRAGRSRPLGLVVLMAALFLQGLSGVAGGIGLTFDPSGRSLQLPLNWLVGSSFEDYFLPGLILLTVLGLVPLVAFYGLLQRRPWSCFLAALVGVALLVWIAVEIAIIGYHADPPLQLIYGALGIVIVGSAALPSTRRGCRQSENARARRRGSNLDNDDGTESEPPL